MENGTKLSETSPKKSEPSGPAVHDLSVNSPSLSEKRKVATVEMITAAKEVVG